MAMPMVLVGISIDEQLTSFPTKAFISYGYNIFWAAILYSKGLLFIDHGPGEHRVVRHFGSTLSLDFLHGNCNLTA